MSRGCNSDPIGKGGVSAWVGGPTALNPSWVNQDVDLAIVLGGDMTGVEIGAMRCCYQRKDTRRDAASTFSSGGLQHGD